MTVVPTLSPDPAPDPAPEAARRSIAHELAVSTPATPRLVGEWSPGLTSVTRLVGPSPLPEAVVPSDHEPTLALVPPPASRTVSARACAPRPPGGDLRLVTGGEEPLVAWATLFCQTVVEVIAGDRSAQQLMRRLDTSVYHSLLERRQELQRVGRARSRQPVRAQVRSVRVSQPTPLVAEVAARVEHGRRSRAMAVRLELVEGRWICTALELG